MKSQVARTAATPYRPDEFEFIALSMLHVRKINIGTNGNRGVSADKPKRTYGNQRKSQKEAALPQELEQAYSGRNPASQIEEYTDYDEVKERKEQYMMRCEALESGKMDLMNNVKKIQETIKTKELQMENITKEQQKIRDFIKNLEEKIDLLENHKKLYQEKVTKWKEKELQEWHKIKLIETTISDLRNY